MFDENKAHEVMGRIRSISIEERLKGITEAQQLFDAYFEGVESIADWSKRAMVVETFYNIIREELRQKHVRLGLRDDSSGEEVKVKTKTTKSTTKTPKPKLTPKFDLSLIQDEFIERMKKELK